MRDRLLVVGVVLAVLAAAASWWFSREEIEVEEPSRPPDTVELLVTSVVDGDTIRAVPQEQHAVWEEGWDTPVRLLLVDAPERERRDEPAECFAAEATTRLTELLPAGSRAWAQLDREPVDQYDRVLAYLWNEQGEFVNLALVEEGFATSVLFEPNDRYHEDVETAEALAKSEGRGLWGVCR